MAGSAIGLGNLWRFPYMVGQNGGAAFIVVYLAAVVFICIPIFLSEAVIGKRAQLSTFGAMEKLAPGTPWKWVGVLAVIVPIILLSYYSVVGGWSIHYLLRALTFSFSDPEITKSALGDQFNIFVSSGWSPSIWHTVFIVLTAIIVALGVKKGIEKFTRISTPLLFVLIMMIMMYSFTLPGAKAGVDYLVKPDFSKLTASSVLAAMGQAFFSLSLGVGCILTYASYLGKKEKLLPTAFGTAAFDLSFAIIAGFAVMPAVFAAGIEPGAGPGLIFESLPFVFATMGRSYPVFSGIIAILFFLTVLIAALTSSVSMLETVVSFLVDQKKMSRRKATLLPFLLCWGLGILCALSGRLFEVFDHMVSDYLMTLGSLLFAIFAGWKMKKVDVLAEIGGNRILYFLMKWAAPIMIVVIFLSNLLMK